MATASGRSTAGIPLPFLNSRSFLVAVAMKRWISLPLLISASLASSVQVGSSSMSRPMTVTGTPNSSMTLYAGASL